METLETLIWSAPTFFSRSFRFVDRWFLFSTVGLEINGGNELGFESVSVGSFLTLCEEFDGTELVSGEFSPAAKTENIAARSMRVVFAGNVGEQ